MIKTIKLELALFDGHINIKTNIWILLILLYSAYSGRPLVYSTLLASVWFSVRTVPLPFEVLSQNESSKNMYTMLPVSLNNIITARYLSIFFVGSAGIALSVIAQFGLLVFLKRVINIGDIVVSIVVGCACILILSALQIPLIYKQGVIKGRAPTSIIMASICLFAFYFGYKKFIQLSLLDALLFVAAFSVVSILLSLASILISTGIVKRNMNL